MPAHRKPTSIHRLTGAMDHDPQRFIDRANEPIVTETLGPPQSKMEADERAAWMEIDRLAPWLTAADRLAVEVAAGLLASFRRSGVSLTPPARLARLESMLGRLGLTPSDRSKVKEPRKLSPVNSFAVHAAGRPHP